MRVLRWCGDVDGFKMKIGGNKVMVRTRLVAISAVQTHAC